MNDGAKEATVIIDKVQLLVEVKRDVFFHCHDFWSSDIHLDPRYPSHRRKFPIFLTDCSRSSIQASSLIEFNYLVDWS